jgi:6,7-dimethyl-8-ribityllumazine synthase
MKASSTRQDIDGNGFRIGIVQSRFNSEITEALTSACVDELVNLGVAKSDIRLLTVPGALECPLILTEMAACGLYDGLIVIGCVIRGETYHFEVVSNESARCVSQIQLDYRIPISNAILTVENYSQAQERSLVKGIEAAQIIVEMVSTIAKFEMSLDD